MQHHQTRCCLARRRSPTAAVTTTIIAKNARVPEIVAGTRIRTKKEKRNAGKEVKLIYDI